MKSHTFPSVLALLLGFLLTSCGTAFWQVPYYAGDRKPGVRDTSGEYTPGNHGTFDLDIHRIGGNHYAKIELFYFPCKTPDVLWNAMTHYPDAPGMDDTKPAARRTCYCLLNEEECGKLRLPAPQANAKPAVLTEQAAAKLQPEHIGTHRVDWLPESMPRDTKHSIFHYPLLPVSAAVFVVIDIPCTVIATTGAFFAITVSGAVNH